MLRNASKLLALAAFSLFVRTASADVVRVSENAFNAGAGLITFSEYPVNTMNPTYAPATYGGGANSPTVNFGGYFVGQAPGASNPSACPAGAAVSGCVLGTPTGPLTLDPRSPQTFITTDSATPTSPVLSGSPLYNGAIAIEFSTPQVGVGLTGGFFDAANSTAITAFDSNGKTIGQVTNTGTGIEFLGLVTSDGSADISGLEFSLVGDEPFGFVIDNVRFGVQGQVTVPSSVTPEPASFMLLGTGMLSFVSLRLRQRKLSA